MMRPSDLAAASMPRLEHAPALLGPVEIVGITELSPCWRPLLCALAGHTPVRWIAGPRSVPAWLDGGAVAIERSEPLVPETGALSASTAYHEALEAMPWARGLLAPGPARPGDVPLPAALPAHTAEHFRALPPHPHPHP